MIDTGHNRASKKKFFEWVILFWALSYQDKDEIHSVYFPGQATHLGLLSSLIGILSPIPMFPGIVIRCISCRVSQQSRLGAFATPKCPTIFLLWQRIIYRVNLYYYNHFWIRKVVIWRMVSLEKMSSLLSTAWLCLLGTGLCLWPR